MVKERIGARKLNKRREEIRKKKRRYESLEKPETIVHT